MENNNKNVADLKPVSQGTAEQILKDQKLYDGKSVKTSLTGIQQKLQTDPAYGNEFLSGLFNKQVIQATLNQFELVDEYTKQFEVYPTNSIGDPIEVLYIDTALPTPFENGLRIPAKVNKRNTFRQIIPTLYRQKFELDVSQDIMEAAFNSEMQYTSFMGVYMNRPNVEREKYMYNILLEGDPNYKTPEGTPAPITPLFKNFGRVITADNTTYGRYNVDQFIPLDELKIKGTTTELTKESVNKFLHDVNSAIYKVLRPNNEFHSIGLTDTGSGDFTGTPFEMALMGQQLIIIVPDSMASAVNYVGYAPIFNDEWLRSQNLSTIKWVRVPDSFFEAYSIAITDIGKRTGSTTTIPAAPVKVQCIITTEKGMQTHFRINTELSNLWAAGMLNYSVNHLWTKQAITLYPNWLITVKQ